MKTSVSDLQVILEYIYYIFYILYIWWFSCRLMSCLSLDALRFSLISKYVWSNYLQFPIHLLAVNGEVPGGARSLRPLSLSWTCCKSSKMRCCDNNVLEFLQIQRLTIERSALVLGEIVSYLAKDVTDTPASRT